MDVLSNFIAMLMQILPLFIIMGIGVLLVKLHIVDQNFSDQGTHVYMDVFLPCSILRAFSPDRITPEMLGPGAHLFFLGAAMAGVGFILAVLFERLLKLDTLTGNICYMSIMFTNFGIIGFGMTEKVYGVQGLVYMNLFCIALRFLYYTFSIYIMQRGIEGESKTNWAKALMNPPVFAIVIALILLFFDIRLPDVVMGTVDMLAGCLAPVGMLVLGVVLARYPMQSLFSGKLVYLVCFIRLIAIPVGMIFAFRALGFVGVVAAVPVLVLALPVGVNCSLLAERFGGNTHFGAQVVFVCTVLSILTVPFILTLSAWMLL